MSRHLLRIEAPRRLPHVIALSTTTHLYYKLMWEVKGVKRDKDHRTAAYRAFNCAITAWHLSDWIWDETRDSNEDFAQEFGHPVRELEEFQEALRGQCRELRLCYWIATGSKHRNVRPRKKPEAPVRAEQVWIELGDARGGPARYGTVAFISDGQERIRAATVFERAKDFWRGFLQRWGGLEATFVTGRPLRLSRAR